MVLGSYPLWGRRTLSFVSHSLLCVVHDGLSCLAVANHNISQVIVSFHKLPQAIKTMLRVAGEIEGGRDESAQKPQRNAEASSLCLLEGPSGRGKEGRGRMDIKHFKHAQNQNIIFHLSFPT